jgi:arylsulfatase A-like enzyme
MSIELNRHIEIDFEVENPNNIIYGEFFYENDEGYVSKRFLYKNNKVNIKIKQLHIKSLRYDPMISKGTIAVKNLKINNKNVSAEDLILKDDNSIESITVEENTIRIVANGEDPYFNLINNIHAPYAWDNYSINYVPVSMYIICLLLFMLYFTIHKKHSKKSKKLILYFTLIYNLMIMLSMSFILVDSHDIPNLFDLVLFFNKFFLEFFIILLLLILSLNAYKFFVFLGIILLIIYVVITFSQIVSLNISGEFITRLGIENLEYIGLMFNFDNAMIIFKLLLLLFVLPYIVSRYIVKHNNVLLNRIYVITSLIGIASLVGFIINTNKDLSEDNIIFPNFSLKHTAMIESYIVESYHKLKHNEIPNLNFITKLKDQYSVDLEINISAKYPLKKRHVYKQEKFLKRKEKPNIILIFTEGLSARTMSMYNDKFNKLTPNLKLFSENTSVMKIENYYNHTAATYNGLHGQLCSLHPIDTGKKKWLKNKRLYTCLPKILKNNGYDTTYLNVHYEKSSKIQEIAKRAGFEHIYSGEELSSRYLGGINKLGGALLDQQSYNMLKNYLLKKETSRKKPFFLSMYTAETHAWTDVNANNGGIRYADGSNEILNTIHNMDYAFGKFWKYFKNSIYFKNTMIVFTADHAHFYGLKYLGLMRKYGEKDYVRSFMDKIPLLIYSPYNDLPKKFDANSRSSINLSPTLLHYLNINNAENSFVGYSLFDKGRNFGTSTHNLFKDGKIYGSKGKHKYTELHTLMREYIEYTRYLELKNKLHAEEK